MVTRYDVISSRWSSQWMFFNFSPGIKVVDKMIQSNYSCVILHVKRKKLLLLTVFTWFLILDKIPDGDHVWWRHRLPAAPPPIKYTSSCREDQRLFSEGKIVSKYCNTSKTQGGGGSINPHSPYRLYNGRGMTLRVRPRVKTPVNAKRILINTAITLLWL